MESWRGSGTCGPLQRVGVRRCGGARQLEKELFEIHLAMLSSKFLEGPGRYRPPLIEDDNAMGEILHDGELMGRQQDREPRSDALDQQLLHRA